MYETRIKFNLARTLELEMLIVVVGNILAADAVPETAWLAGILTCNLATREQLLYLREREREEGRKKTPFSHLNERITVVTVALYSK